jgi:Salmonella virulence plasmid 65kDa B protein/Insecticide toxin TcdB middle/N-terminal region
MAKRRRKTRAIRHYCHENVHVGEPQIRSEPPGEAATSPSGFHSRTASETGGGAIAGSAAAPAVTIPKGGGAIKGIGEKFAVNVVNGTSTMSVPLAVSPGRAGFAPHLDLSYDSGSGNGPFGFGWSLSIPSVSRKTDKGLPRYDDADESDVFILSGAEDLVPVLRPDGSRETDDITVPGFTIDRCRPRIEGLFARIERWTETATGDAHWRSISRDNITTIYGETAESRIAGGDRVFTWLICASYDDRGNAIVYSYVGEDDANVDRFQLNERNRSRSANRYLKRVRYGNTVSRLLESDLSKTDWLFEVVFDYDEDHYEDVALDPHQPASEQHRFVRASELPGGTWRVRPDPFSLYRSGFEVRTYRRCRRVLMFHRFHELGDEPCLVRATGFDYLDLDYANPVSIDAELSHDGSTRFASFIGSVTQSGFVRDENAAIAKHNGVDYVTYLVKSFPPVEFGYSKAVIHDAVQEPDPASLENLPVGVDGTRYQWVDLDGEGIAGVLTEQSGAWYYKSSLGSGEFGSTQTVANRPSLANLSARSQRLLDLAGDGHLSLVDFTGFTPGYYERTDSEDWDEFRSFKQLPNVTWDDPNLRFVDLNGDGHADVLVTEDDALTWYPSLAQDGFAASSRVPKPWDEERGPRLLFADGTQSIYLADMSGDGLNDLARIRNGDICYWPNLGYCRFGSKVTMDDAPWLDNPDQFEEARVRLADIDGSGTSDLIYLGRDSVRLYFNQSGNRWSRSRPLSFPPIDNVASVLPADLLGNGTACLVWATPLPSEAPRVMRYVDLMGGTKPHLLVRSANNFGTETRVEYAASTKFYLADKHASTPWITRAPFPVHVVARVETDDRVSRNRFVTRYAYHHGYFDGVEREFRGFGFVEQWDTEEFAAFMGNGELPPPTNGDYASHVPPVLMRTWFHTGVYLGREHVSDFFAGLLGDTTSVSYYREPGLTDAQARDHLLMTPCCPTA